MTARSYIAAIAGAVVIAMLAPFTVARAADFRGQNGYIAFLSQGDCLQMVRADGTGRHEPGACGIYGAVQISPDGSRLLAAVENPEPEYYDVRSSRLDGSDPVVFPVGNYYYAPA